MESNRIPLSASEVETIRQLRELHGNLPAGYPSAIEGILRRSRVLLTAVMETSPDGLHSGQVALLGILYRTHELFLGGLEQLCRGHKHVWASCLRGLVETFGATVFVTEKPNRLESLVRGTGVKVSRLREAAKRRISGLRADVEWLDAVSHPGTTSMFLGMRIANEADRLTIFAVPPPSLDAEEVNNGVDVLIGVCQLIQDEVSTILCRSVDVITAGQVIGVPVWKGGSVEEPKA